MCSALIGCFNYITYLVFGKELTHLKHLSLFDFWFWGFCTVCKVNFPTTFREPLWVPSSMVISSSSNL